jgi:DNA-binding protein H-NS
LDGKAAFLGRPFLCSADHPLNCEVKNIDLNVKSVEELWALHEEIASMLAAKMQAEKLKLQKRLDQLGVEVVHDLRRPYPEVHPKFRNPNPPHQTWSGRGKQPHWIREVLAKGRQLDDLRISEQMNDIPDTKPQTIAH